MCIARVSVGHTESSCWSLTPPSLLELVSPVELLLFQSFLLIVATLLLDQLAIVVDRKCFMLAKKWLGFLAIKLPLHFGEECIFWNKQSRFAPVLINGIRFLVNCIRYQSTEHCKVDFWDVKICRE